MPLTNRQMKKAALSLMAGCMALVSVAQKFNVQNAFSAMQDGQLAKAYEYIELAKKHEKTANDAKTWTYRGQILMQMAFAPDVEVRTMVEDPMLQAAESWKKAIELDEKERYTKEIKQLIPAMENQLLNAGVQQYNEKNFEAAYMAFYTADIMAGILDAVDSLAVFNAAIAADKAEMHDEAIVMYQKCADIGYNGASIYPLLANTYKEKGDSAQFLKTLQEGREKYPDDQSIILEELNYYLASKKYEEARTNLALAIEKDPENEILYFAQGSVLESLGNLKEARTSYEKAIELKPDYFEPYYNLGAMIYNEGVQLNNQANELDFRKEGAKIETLQKQADDKFKEALPVLEKAHELNKDDQSTKESLMQLYVRMKMNDKYNEMKSSLNK